MLFFLPLVTTQWPTPPPPLHPSTSQHPILWWDLHCVGLQFAVGTDREAERERARARDCMRCTMDGGPVTSLLVLDTHSPSAIRSNAHLCLPWNTPKTTITTSTTSTSVVSSSSRRVSHQRQSSVRRGWILTSSKNKAKQRTATFSEELTPYFCITKQHSSFKGFTCKCKRVPPCALLS